MKHDPEALDGLDQFCTVRQLETIEAVRKHKSVRKAAKALGMNTRSIFTTIAAIKRKQELAGPLPEGGIYKAVPEGFRVRGLSTHVGKDGQTTNQWIKASVDEEQREAMLREFAATLAEDVKGLAPLTPAPKRSNAELMCVFPLGDPHFGMYSWWQETGADFDLEIAERLTCAAIDRLIASAPNAAEALLINLGDMYHADNQKNQSQSGHQLDVDGRWAKVQQVGLRSMVYALRRLLEKYPKVVFRINPGNHDGHSSYTLALMLSCWFHEEPRLQVDLSPSLTWYYQFGQVLVGSTHGDTIKGKDLMGVMAADKPAEWGTSKYRHWIVGHVHHHDSKEYPGGIVEYFRTLAARDAWHAGQGYRAGRDMCLIVMHKEYGEIERHRCDVAMLEQSPEL